MNQALIDSGALSAMDNDALLSRREANEDLRATILAVAEKDGCGTADAGRVRPLLAERTRQYPKKIGAAFNALARQGIATWTGQWVPSNNAESGNRDKQVKLWAINTTALRALIEKENGE